MDLHLFPGFADPDSVVGHFRLVREYFIKWMKRHNVSEAQRDASIDPYGVEKKGVPTMGGVIIIVSIIIPCLLFGRLRNIYMILMLITTVWLGVLGFADDYIKRK